MSARNGIRPLLNKNRQGPIADRVLLVRLPLARRVGLYAAVMAGLFVVSMGVGAAMSLVFNGGGASEAPAAQAAEPWAEGRSGLFPFSSRESALGMGGPLEPLSGDFLSDPDSAPPLKVLSYTISPNDNLYTTLQCHGVPPNLILSWCELAKDKFDLARVRPGMTFNLYQAPDRSYHRFELNLNSRERLVIDRDEEGYISFLENFEAGELSEAAPLSARLPAPAWVDPATGRHYYRGVVESNFYEAASRAGMTSAKIMALTREFGAIAFARDLRPGDRFSVVTAPGDRPGEEGPLLAVMIESRGRAHHIFRFEEGGQAAYFDDRGQSSRRTRLIVPLRYTRISSGYTHSRYHPILKINRPHLGIDYAAPRGTPVRAAADGVVEFVGWKGDFGKTVLIRHDSAYKTQYAHLAGYGRGISSGRRVKQGQVIGYVGMTGLATGPHLDYRVYLNGKPVNPLRVTGIPLSPVKDKSRFESVKKEMAAELNRELPYGPARPWPSPGDSLSAALLERKSD